MGAPARRLEIADCFAMPYGDTSTGSKFIWAPPVAGLRPLTAKEIDCLAAALSKPVECNYLAFWVSQSIAML